MAKNTKTYTTGPPTDRPYMNYIFECRKSTCKNIKVLFCISSIFNFFLSFCLLQFCTLCSRKKMLEKKTSKIDIDSLDSLCAYEMITFVAVLLKGEYTMDDSSGGDDDSYL